jgi:hypothetical protein
LGIAHVRALALALLLATSAGAHEIGTVRANAVFHHDGTYRVDVSPRRDVQVRFDGQTFTMRLPFTYATYALTTTVEGREPQTQWVDGDEWSRPVSLNFITRVDIARQYLTLGFTHIVPRGLDHILFILGIFLLSLKVRPLLTQVTAFTIAHSITLALATYGIVAVSPRIVEPLIALSIVYIAIENLTTSEMRRSRVAVVFAFGLLHGMGFAGILKELGLPRSRFVTALVAFNAGVELGQLAVILVAFLVAGWWVAQLPSYRRRFVMPASAIIAATGVFWTMQRILALT